MNFYSRGPVRVSGAVSCSPELAALVMTFILALWMYLGFDCCWVGLWWVVPSSWLTEGHSAHHILCTVVQVQSGCAEAGASIIPRL